MATVDIVGEVRRNWREAVEHAKGEDVKMVARMGGLMRAFIYSLPRHLRRMVMRLPREARLSIVRTAARTGRVFGMFISSSSRHYARRFLDTSYKRRALTLFIRSPEPRSLSKLFSEFGRWADEFEKRGFRDLAELLEDLRVKKKEKFWIGDEACSGLDIVYGGEVYLICDPETGDVVREEPRIIVEVTATMRTGGGHEPIAVEVHAYTKIPAMSPREVGEVEEKIEYIMFQVCQERWGLALVRSWERTSVLYNGEKHVESLNLYPEGVPDWPKIAYVEERRGKYPAYKRYPSEGYIVIGEGES